MPITPADIRNTVSKEDDFGHEMRVGKIIRSIPTIRLEHGGTYVDGVTGKPRQFDYRCFLKKEFPPDGACNYSRAHVLSLAVECKNLHPSAPLAVCGAKRSESESFHDLIQSHSGRFKSKQGTTTIGPSSITLRTYGDDAFYMPGQFVGKSLVRIRTDKSGLTPAPDSDVYDKWAQALSSTVEVARLACDDLRGEWHRTGLVRSIAGRGGAR